VCIQNNWTEALKINSMLLIEKDIRYGDRQYNMNLLEHFRHKICGEQCKDETKRVAEAQPTEQKHWIIVSTSGVFFYHQANVYVDPSTNIGGASDSIRVSVVVESIITYEPFVDPSRWSIVRRLLFVFKYFVYMNYYNY